MNEEMSAKEVLETINEICDTSSGCSKCPLFDETICHISTLYAHCLDIDEIISICRQWKADHEKKEPEIEWGWIVDSCEFFLSENDAIEYCEKIAKEKPNFEHEIYRACRIKEV